MNPVGRPRLPIRLMASLLYLKYVLDLSDEAVVERWSERVVLYYFSGRAYYKPKLPCDATQIGRFRMVICEAGVEKILKATIDTAAQTGVVPPQDFRRVIVDTTIQEKAIAFPKDSRLLEIARHKGVGVARAAGVTLKQTFVNEARQLRCRAGGYAHAKQYRRLKRVLRRQRTILGRLIREVRRKWQPQHLAAETATRLTSLPERCDQLRTQPRRGKDKGHKRRQAIEPVIRHLKADHRMARCWLKGVTGTRSTPCWLRRASTCAWLMRAVLAGRIRVFSGLAAVCGRRHQGGRTPRHRWPGNYAGPTTGLRIRLVLAQSSIVRSGFWAR